LIGSRQPAKTSALMSLSLWRRGSGSFRAAVRLLLAVTLLAWTVLSAASLQPGQFFTQGDSQRKRIALTFDDGPGPETGRFLELLSRHNLHATFFVQGALVPGEAEVIRRMVQGGHEIASHTSAHTNYLAHFKQLAAKAKAGGGTEASAEAQARKDLLEDHRRTRAAIEKYAGLRVTLCRMPHGIDRPWIREVAREAGVTLVNWTYGADWNKGSAKELLPGYLGAIRPGAILLLHDGGKERSKSLAIAEAVIQTAQAKGYEIVTVSQLLAR
jgi:peptidoglycan/xylan/chitin deacetylase (PgdA/CDA1 family)